MVKRVRPDHSQEHLVEIVTRLREAREAPHVRLAFKDGRVYDGAITFVERLGTGRLINVDTELSIQFSVYELADVSYDTQAVGQASA